MKKMITLTTLSFLATMASCSQLYTGRSYLSEMENDDSSYFHPREDFPVVAGDTGRDWETAGERRKRTPASESEREELQGQRSLKNELRQLESKQSDESLAFYEKYKRHLATTSEKIYFLKLPNYEKKEYLASRGFMSSDRQPASEHKEMFGVRPSTLSPGMSKDDVMGNWGRPSRVEVAGNPSYENERWLYNVNGATKYIYFESGRVEGWE